MAAEPMLTQVSDPQGWDRPGPRRHARVQFTDGTWHSTTVLGWRHRDDHWYAHLRWPGGHTEWRLYDPRYIHPELAGLGDLMTVAGRQSRRIGPLSTWNAGEHPVARAGAAPG